MEKWNLPVFLTWPLVLPIKTIFSKDWKPMGLTYLAGLLIGYFILASLTVTLQWLLWLSILLAIGVLWGHPIAEFGEDNRVGKYISTFAAGFLLAFPVLFFMSHLVIGFIFQPFK